MVQEIIHICGYKKWYADGISTETNMYPSSPREGGIKTVKLLVLLFISDALACIHIKANNLQPLSSCQKIQDDVILTSVRHDDVAVRRHFKIMCQ